ncbi:MAG: branched-chain amino acid ABC transporter permease [Boseongicola sp. SB0673_bin_14]|nr:branched-chain amino acid ABC transporter permease [Boseongicola sp.]MXW86626.1 branched-chain amino acid ABC transporter permease [Boseongicola sp. SB0667_bin_21]MYI69196.1 branched-chain amino acid ABC transporter permease [Boseongicola sp. SB0673_bin_14]
MSEYAISIASNMGIIAFVALSAYVILVAGEISFGQQAYFGIGAYVSGVASAMWGWPFVPALALGSLAAAVAALAVGVLTLRLRGLYFAIATLCFAEMIRLGLNSVRVQVEIDGELVGPDGAEGFGDIRWIFENNVTPLEFMFMIYGLLGAALALMLLVERSHLGAVLRMIGQDPLLASSQGIDVRLCKLLAITFAGMLAGLGGCLYAHFATYVEPNVFNVMLGVHGLAYGLIGGLGTALGPIIGVVLDIGFLEGIRAIQGYRMIVFGGLVAVLLIVMPRGILDEARVHRIKRWMRRS